MAQLQNLDNYEEKYGEFITAATAAKILKISKKGFDSSLYGRSPDFENIRRLRLKIGNRLYFSTREFFEAILTSKEDK